ncbi:unnamed protein product [Pedinophyceae sp. YPF-701]|nr:unnamed protein product [Pedinophyceae sp. YPF-701]
MSRNSSQRQLKAKQEETARGIPLEHTAPADVLMEGIVEKLKLLQYEQTFCKTRKPAWPALSRGFFALPGSREAVQPFYYFVYLAGWLLREGGHQYESPAQFEDPNVLISGLLSALRKAGFNTGQLSASKLRSGVGDAVCGVLDALVDHTLEVKGFKFQPPLRQKEPSMEYQDIDMTSEEEEEVGGFADSFEEAGGDSGLTSLTAAPPVPTGRGRGRDVADGAKDAAAPARSAAAPIESSIRDVQSWRIEAERVAPQLRLRVESDVRDWRAHLERAKAHEEEVLRLLPPSKAHLGKLISEVTLELDKLASRERNLNEQFETQRMDYQSAKDKLDTTRANHNRESDKLAELTNQLQHIETELEDVRNMLDEKGSSISDSSPVLRMKAAIRDLQREVRDMDVRVGVVQHSLVQHALKDHREAATGRGLAAM